MALKKLSYLLYLFLLSFLLKYCILDIHVLHAHTQCIECVYPFRLCLSLIKDESPSILVENNLIQSLELLQEFNIIMLPIKGKRERIFKIASFPYAVSFLIIVRLCENKLDLIKQALDSSPTAYKKYDKVKNSILNIILSPSPPL